MGMGAPAMLAAGGQAGGRHGPRGSRYVAGLRAAIIRL